MKSPRLVAIAALTLLVPVTVVLASGSPATAAPAKTLSNIVAGHVRQPTLPVISGNKVVGTKRLPFLSSGLLKAAAEQAAAAAQASSGVVSGADDRLQAADGAVQSAPEANVTITPGTLGCRTRNNDGAVRVNQDCSFRRQAEEEITANPADPANLLAGQNDSRVGFNQCGIDYSTDSGKHWGDLLPPFRQKLNNPAGETGPVAGDPNSHTLLGSPGTGHTYDAGSDPAVAFDSRGRSYFSCVMFDVNSNASGLYVTASPAGAQGAYFYNIAANDRRFMVAEDNSPLVFHDKNFITADTNPASRNRDNVYVTWTVFRFDPACRNGTAAAPAQCESPIFGSMSTDGGFHWSTPEKISGSSSKLCFFGNALDPRAGAHDCNFNQGSDPVTLANGDLLVPFNNVNTAATDPNGQQLAVRCSPTGSSAAGTAHLNCASPTRIGSDVITGAPTCDFGRGPEECVPGPFIRTNDFPRAQTTAAAGSNVYVTWQDYRHGEYDIQLARTTDGGRTWSATTQVNPDRGMDHYFPAVDNRGGRTAVSYFRSERIPGENTTPTGGFAPAPGNGVQTGLTDYVLAGGHMLATPFPFVEVGKPTVAPDGIQAGFNGDYSGLVLVGDTAHPIWSDTRNVNPDPVNAVSHDEDVFTAARTLPTGNTSSTTQTTLHLR